VDQLQGPIEAYVAGDSGYLTQSAQLVAPPVSEKTLFRWVAALAAKAQVFREIAVGFLHELRPDWNIEKDHRLTQAAFPSARTPSKNDALNCLYQVFILRDYFCQIVEPKYYLCWLIFQSRLRPTQLGNEHLGIIRDNGPP
jgi:hypothetical protein